MLPVIILFFFFYLLAIFQNSFFSHFPIFGLVPNLVFIAYALLVFFEERGRLLQVAWYALLAGLFASVFSYQSIGISVLIFFGVGIAAKKVQDSLHEAEQARPIIHFIPLFLFSYLAYSIVSGEGIGWPLAWELGYNLLVAIIGFYVYQKLQAKPR